MSLKIQKLEIEPTVRQEANFAELQDNLKMRIVLNLIQPHISKFEDQPLGYWGIITAIASLRLVNKKLNKFFNTSDNMLTIIKAWDRIRWHARDEGSRVCIEWLGVNQWAGMIKKGMLVFRDPQFMAALAQWKKQNEKESSFVYRVKDSVLSSTYDPMKAGDNYKIVTDVLAENEQLPQAARLNVNRLNFNGDGALHVITELEKGKWPSHDIFDMVTRLLNAGADINITNCHKLPALSNVFAWPSDCLYKIPLIKEFLARGADLTIRDRFGKTPFHQAMELEDNLDGLNQIKNKDLRLQLQEKMENNREIKTIVLNYIKEKNIRLSDDLKELHDKHVRESAH